METVDKLEAMFQKAEADIEYVEKRLKFDFMTNTRDAGTFEGNPVELLEKLSAVKARHAALCAQVEEIAAEQKRSMDLIHSHLDTTVQIVQQLQTAADVQVPPLTEEEEAARDTLCSFASALSLEATSTSKPQQEEPAESRDVGERRDAVRDEEFQAVPLSLRGNLKRLDLNTLYAQLTQHFSANNRGTISAHKMKMLNMKVSDSALKTLEHLKLIEVDKKGLVSFLTKN